MSRRVLPHYWSPLQEVGYSEDVKVTEKGFAPLCLFGTESWDERRRRLLRIFPPKVVPGETKWNWFDVLQSYMRLFRLRGLKLRFEAVFLQDEMTYYRWLHQATVDTFIQTLTEYIKGSEWYMHNQRKKRMHWKTYLGPWAVMGHVAWDLVSVHQNIQYEKEYYIRRNKWEEMMNIEYGSPGQFAYYSSEEGERELMREVLFAEDWMMNRATLQDLKNMRYSKTNSVLQMLVYHYLVHETGGLWQLAYQRKKLEQYQQQYIAEECRKERAFLDYEEVEKEMSSS